MSETLKKVEEFERNELKSLLDQCKPEQIAFFNRLYGSIETIPSEKIPRAIEQCEQTIAKNSKSEEGI